MALASESGIALFNNPVNADDSPICAAVIAVRPDPK